MKVSRRSFFGALVGAAITLASFYCPALLEMEAPARWAGWHNAYREIDRAHLLALMKDARRRMEFQPSLRWVME